MEPVMRDYCTARSGGIERIQMIDERRTEQFGKRIDDLARIEGELSRTVERLATLLEKQDERLNRLENRGIGSFLESSSGKSILKISAVCLLILLCTSVGINIFSILKEVF